MNYLKATAQLVSEKLKLLTSFDVAWIVGGQLVLLCLMLIVILGSMAANSRLSGRVDRLERWAFDRDDQGNRSERMERAIETLQIADEWRKEHFLTK